MRKLKCIKLMFFKKAVGNKESYYQVKIEDIGMSECIRQRKRAGGKDFEAHESEVHSGILTELIYLGNHFVGFKNINSKRKTKVFNVSLDVTAQYGRKANKPLL